MARGILVTFTEVVDEEHRKVITLRSIRHEGIDSSPDIFQMLVGSFSPVKTIFRPLLTELLVIDVFGFGKTVGIEEKRIIIFQSNILFGEIEIRQDSEREIRLDFQFTNGIGQYHRRVVPGIAETEMSVCQVQDSEEEGDEHIAFVHIRHPLVHP